MNFCWNGEFLWNSFSCPLWFAGLWKAGSFWDCLNMFVSWWSLARVLDRFVVWWLSSNTCKKFRILITVCFQKTTTPSAFLLFLCFLVGLDFLLIRRIALCQILGFSRGVSRDSIKTSNTCRRAPVELTEETCSSCSQISSGFISIAALCPILAWLWANGNVAQKSHTPGGKVHKTETHGPTTSSTYMLCETAEHERAKRSVKWPNRPDRFFCVFARKKNQSNSCRFNPSKSDGAINTSASFVSSKQFFSHLQPGQVESTLLWSSQHLFFLRRLLIEKIQLLLLLNAHLLLEWILIKQVKCVFWR